MIQQVRNAIATIGILLAGFCCLTAAAEREVPTELESRLRKLAGAYDLVGAIRLAEEGTTSDGIDQSAQEILDSSRIFRANYFTIGDRVTFTKVQKAYKQIIEQFPDTEYAGMAAMNLGFIHAYRCVGAKPDLSVAITWYARAAEILKDPERRRLALGDKAALERKAGRYADAVLTYEALEKLMPDGTLKLYHRMGLCRALLAIGKRERAVREIQIVRDNLDQLRPHQREDLLTCLVLMDDLTGATDVLTGLMGDDFREVAFERMDKAKEIVETVHSELVPMSPIERLTWATEALRWWSVGDKPVESVLQKHDARSADQHHAETRACVSGMIKFLEDTTVNAYPQYWPGNMAATLQTPLRGVPTGSYDRHERSSVAKVLQADVSALSCPAGVRYTLGALVEGPALTCSVHGTVTEWPWLVSPILHPRQRPENRCYLTDVDLGLLGPVQQFRETGGYAPWQEVSQEPSYYETTSAERRYVRFWDRVVCGSEELARTKELTALFQADRAVRGGITLPVSPDLVNRLLKNVRSRKWHNRFVAAVGLSDLMFWQMGMLPRSWGPYTYVADLAGLLEDREPRVARFAAQQLALAANVVTGGLYPSHVDYLSYAAPDDLKSVAPAVLSAVRKTRDPVARRACAAFLSYVGESRAEKLFVRLARATRASDRLSAARGLASVRADTSVPILVNLLLDPDARAREAAARSLGILGAPEALAPLTELFAAEADRIAGLDQLMMTTPYHTIASRRRAVENVRLAVARALVRIGKAQREGATLLLEKDYTRGMGRVIADAFINEGSKESVAFLLKADDRHREIPPALAKAVTSAKSPLCDHLAEIAEGDEEQLAIRAAKLLLEVPHSDKLEPYCKRTLAACLVLANSNDASVKATASALVVGEMIETNTLFQQGDVNPLLKSSLRSDEHSVVKGCLGTIDQQMRTVLRHGNTDLLKAAVEPLTKHADESVRRAARATVARLEKRSDVEVALIERFDEQGFLLEEYRYRPFNMLKDSRITDALIRTIRSAPRKEQRDIAADILWQVVELDDAPRLFDLMEEVPLTGTAGKFSLATGRKIDSISGAVVSLKVPENASEQTRASALAAARKALEKDDPRFRSPAIVLLGKLRDSESATRIENLRAWAESFESEYLQEHLLGQIDSALRQIRGEAQTR